MKYRIWFNKGNTDPQQVWVVEPEGGPQYLVSRLEIQGPSRLVVDFQSCPQGWIETEGICQLRVPENCAVIEKLT